MVKNAKTGWFTARMVTVTVPPGHPLQRLWINVSLKGPRFTHDQCCVRGTWLSLVLSVSPPCILCPLPRASGEIPDKELFISEQCFWPISSYLSYWEQLKKPICKCELPVRLDGVLNSWPFFPLLWEPAWLYRMNGIFQTYGTCESKDSSIKQTKKKRNALFAKMFSKGKITCWI